jgi:hypothetical protein
MHRLLMILLALIFPFVGLIPASQQTAQQQPNRPPSIDSFFSSLTRIEICPFFPSSVVTGKPEVTLIVKVTGKGANGFDNITATVEVGGFDPACATIVSCTTKIIW